MDGKVGRERQLKADLKKRISGGGDGNKEGEWEGWYEWSDEGLE
jgi:hypothetical protein